MCGADEFRSFQHGMLRANKLHKSSTSCEKQHEQSNNPRLQLFRSPRRHRSSGQMVLKR